MATDPIDIDGILGELEGDDRPWNGLAPATTIGHMHLHVSDMAAARAFYSDLGFTPNFDLGSFADFVPAAIGRRIDERLEYAEWNLGVNGIVLDLRLKDCLEDEWDFEYAMADPARRVAGRRTLDPDDFSPNPRLLAERMAGLRLGLMKLSPLLPTAEKSD